MTSPVDLSGVLCDPIDEQAIARMCHRIREGRESQAVSWLAVLRMAALGFAIAVALQGLLQWLTYEPEVRSATMNAVGAGPLRSIDGRRLAIVDLPAGSPAEVWSLSEGSTLTFDGRTLWEPLAQSSTLVVSSLRRGTATFEIAPGGPRRWVIEAGPVTVEVIGTRFVVYRDDARVKVKVERGAVVVRGKPVPDGVQRLSAGESIEVSIVQGKEPSKRAEDVEARKGVNSTTSSWRAHAGVGEYRAAYVALGTGGVRRESLQAKGLDELLALADVARLSGHPAEAVVPLSRIVARYSGHPEAGVAAVTLGRMQLDQLGSPAGAADTLERALVLPTPAALREVVYARLVEAYSKAGNRSAAEVAMARYEREFPDGRQLEAMARWLPRD